MSIAALAPIISRLVPGRPPQVLFLILGGVLIGPHILGFADSDAIELIAGLGLGFLFLLAGYELDPGLLRERPGRYRVDHDRPGNAAADPARTEHAHRNVRPLRLRRWRSRRTVPDHRDLAVPRGVQD